MLYRGLLHKMLSRTWHKHASKTWYRSPYINRIVVCIGGANPCTSQIALNNIFGLVSSWHRNESSEVSIHGYHVPTKNETITQCDDYRQRFNTLASEFPQLNAAFDVAEATKDIRDTLMDYCSEAEPDLVAIGTGGSTHYLKLTSLVEYVVRESPCDVLIVREQHNTAATQEEVTSEDEDNGNVAEFIEPSIKCDNNKAILPGLHNNRPMKVLVCFGSNNWEDSIEALRAAIRLCRPGDEVQLVTTPDFSAGGNAIHVVAPPDEGTTIEDVLMGDLKEVMDEHETDDLILSAKVIPASPLPAAALCEYAESENVDIMATGYGGHSHLFHPNSFPFYIAHKAHCSVLVARQPTIKEKEQQEEDITDNREEQQHHINEYDGKPLEATTSSSSATTNTVVNATL